MKRTQISLSEEDREVLDAEATRTGLSMSALIRGAIRQTYGSRREMQKDLAAIDSALGAWQGREFDGKTYVANLRSGKRLDETAAE